MYRWEDGDKEVSQDTLVERTTFTCADLVLRSVNPTPHLTYLNPVTHPTTMLQEPAWPHPTLACPSPTHVCTPVSVGPLFPHKHTSHPPLPRTHTPEPSPLTPTPPPCPLQAVTCTSEPWALNTSCLGHTCLQPIQLHNHHDSLPSPKLCQWVHQHLASPDPYISMNAAMLCPLALGKCCTSGPHLPPVHEGSTPDS